MMEDGYILICQAAAQSIYDLLAKQVHDVTFPQFVGAEMRHGKVEAVVIDGCGDLNLVSHVNSEVDEVAKFEVKEGELHYREIRTVFKKTMGTISSASPDGRYSRLLETAVNLRSAIEKNTVEIASGPVFAC